MRSETSKQTMALASSPLGRLVDQQASPLLKLIIASVAEEDAFVVQLACKTLHAIVQERFATRGGVKTKPQGVLSSVTRFKWVRGFPPEAQPAWLLRWDWQTCECIARMGESIELLKYARDQGCPWDASTCRAAAGGGHLEVLQWARANGCPWDEGALT